MAPFEEEGCLFRSSAVVHGEDTLIKFPTALYGRRNELERLASIFECAATIETIKLEEKQRNGGYSQHDCWDDEDDLSSSPVVFLSGLSGCGKSALLQEFRLQRLQNNEPHTFLSGKCEEMRTSDPFRAILDAIGDWCKRQTNNPHHDNHDDAWPYLVTHEFKRKLVDIMKDDIPLLLEFIPTLSSLLLGEGNTTDADDSRSTTQRKTTQSINPTKLKRMLQSLFRAMCFPGRPLILHLDDLQWADQASLKFLRVLLLEDTPANFMFVGSFRSNYELYGNQQELTKLIQEVEIEESCSSRRVEQLALKNLSMEDTSEFIGDALELTLVAPEEMVEITRAVYSKSLGNVNMTMQAINHLVRNQILYFEPNLCRWQWDVSEHVLEEAVFDNVVDMIGSRLAALPERLQQVLLVASYIRNVFGVDMLLHALQTVGLGMSRDELRKCLEDGVLHGLLRDTTSALEFSFAHDSIQESAQRLLTNDEERQHLFIRLGMSLRDQAMSQEEGQDWMLFTAAHHWNKARKSAANDWPRTDEERIMVARLNVETASACLGWAAFPEAITFLSNGIESLGNEDQRWPLFYDEILDIYNLLMDAQYSQGLFDELENTIQMVLRHAHSVHDKGRAFVHSIGIVMQGKNRNHDLAIQKGIQYLTEMGVEIRASPTDVQDEDIHREEKKRSLALGRRKVTDLAREPIMEDDTVVAVLEQVARASIYSGKLPFVYLLGQVAIQLCAKNGISEYLPRIYMYSQMYFRKLGLNHLAYDSAVSCKELVDGLEDCSIEGYCKVAVTCNNGLQLFRPCRLAVDVYEDCYTKSMRAGDTEFASLIANSQGMCFFLSGIPLTVLAERNFEIFEEESRRFNQPASVYMMFMIYRQLLLNLQGRSENPVVLDGEAMTERQVLKEFSPDTLQYKQTVRDFSSCKLMAACIYGDMSVMEAMIENLKTWPEFDVLLHRLHMRLAWMSLAAVLLARETKAKKYVEMATKYKQFYEDSAKQGNPNAKVIFECLQAETSQSKVNYNKAIKACQEKGFLHLEAMMNEHCGAYQIKRGKRVKADKYIAQAFQLYRQYGALGKCKQMQKTYGALVGDCTPVNYSQKDKWDSAKSLTSHTALTADSASGLLSLPLSEPPVVQAS